MKCYSTLIPNGLRSDIFGSVQSRGKTKSLYHSLSWQSPVKYTCTEFVTQNTTEKKQQASTKCEVNCYPFLSSFLPACLPATLCLFVHSNQHTLYIIHCTLYIIHLHDLYSFYKRKHENHVSLVFHCVSRA